MMFLLDTNAWITHLRTKGTSKLSQRLASTPEWDVATSPITRAELMFGALRGPTPAAEVRVILALLQRVRTFDFDDATADVCAAVQADLEGKGLRIGGYDYIIAATALVHGLIVVTHNTREFSRVPNLKIDDWQ